MFHLENDAIMVILGHELEVLDRRHRHATVEVEDIRAHLFVPFGRLVDVVKEVGQITFFALVKHLVLLCGPPDRTLVRLGVDLRDRREGYLAKLTG